MYFFIVHTIHFVVRVQFNLVCPALETNKWKTCFWEMKSRDAVISLRYFTPKCSNGFFPNGQNIFVAFDHQHICCKFPVELPAWSHCALGRKKKCLQQVARSHPCTPPAMSKSCTEHRYLEINYLLNKNVRVIRKWEGLFLQSALDNRKYKTDRLPWRFWCQEARLYKRFSNERGGEETGDCAVRKHCFVLLLKEFIWQHQQLEYMPAILLLL